MLQEISMRFTEHSSNVLYWKIFPLISQYTATVTDSLSCLFPNCIHSKISNQNNGWPGQVVRMHWAQKRLRNVHSSRELGHWGSWVIERDTAWRRTVGWDSPRGSGKGWSQRWERSMTSEYDGQVNVLNTLWLMLRHFETSCTREDWAFSYDQRKLSFWAERHLGMLLQSLWLNSPESRMCSAGPRQHRASIMSTEHILPDPALHNMNQCSYWKYVNKAYRRKVPHNKLKMVLCWPPRICFGNCQNWEIKLCCRTEIFRGNSRLHLFSASACS